ncbi:hypothetical protein N9V92_03440 [Luminiphilus sp.]|nr:hypothetical protein [Luminiphilus sp.]
MKNVIIILCSIYAGSSLAEPISLLCTANVGIDGEREKAIHHLYIDIEEDEILYRASDEMASEKMDWVVLEDVKVDRLSVSGTWFLGSKEIHTTYTVHRTDLELNQTMSIFGDTKKLRKAECEIADFKIEERAF